MIILQILATTGLTLVLYLTGVFVVFTPLPILFTVWKKGTRLAIVATVLSLGVLVGLYRVLGPLDFLPMMVFYPDRELSVVTGLSLVYFSYYLTIGWVVALASYYPWKKIEPVCAGMTLTALAVPGLAIFLVARGMGLDLSGEATRALNGLLQKMLDRQNGAGLSAEDFAYLRDYAPVLIKRVIEILPAFWIGWTLLVLSLNILFLRKWIVAPRDTSLATARPAPSVLDGRDCPSPSSTTGEGREGRQAGPFSAWPDFSLWRIGERWIWTPIGAGGLFFLNLYLFGLASFGIFLTNILIVLAAVYFFQGLAITSFFFRKKLTPLARLLFYVAIFLFLQVVGVAIVAVGLFDFWFDFRKLKRVGNSPLSPS